MVTRKGSWTVVILAALTGCLGRVERAEAPRGLPFHTRQDSLEEFPRASVEAPAAVGVATQVQFEPFVDYYPLPVGVFRQDASLGGVSRWATITVAPSAGTTLQQWFARAVTSGSGSPRTVRGVVTQFEWHALGYTLSAGRIATEIVVTDGDGAVQYRATRVTRARVPFVDALFRTHVREWLGDPAFVAALQGGTP
ncbi:MAG TPA: hypothetical protein VM513_16810 [Kofleriaceae bacterium]|nr:hypothetical protein [Kofleriaceae bacterium]